MKILVSAMVVTSLCIAFSGCAGSSLQNYKDSKPLPVELPKDYKDKFEVRESLDAVPAGPEVSAPVVAQAAKAKLKTVKVHLPPPPKGFSYPSRRPKVDPIWLGERHVFEITYFGVLAGDFTLDVLPFKQVNNRKVYHVRGNAVSSKVFSLFYKLNDTIESFFDFDGLFSYRFHLTLDETKQTRDSLELYDSEKQQTFFWNRWDHVTKGHTEVKEFYPMKPFPQDSISALYYIRTLPLVDGAVYNVPIVSEGKTWEAIVQVVKREDLDTPMGKIRAIVLKPDTKYQGVLQKRGDSFIWISDDERRMVLRLEAQVRIGTVVGRLKSFGKGEPPQN